MAAREVLRTSVGETAEVDDEIDARGLGCDTEVLGSLAIAFRIRVVHCAAPHRVNEVVGDGNAFEGLLEAFVFENVRLDDLRAGLGKVLRLLGGSGDRANGLAALELAQASACGRCSRWRRPPQGTAQPYRPPVISRSFAWSCRACTVRTVPERERVTSDSVDAWPERG